MMSPIFPPIYVYMYISLLLNDKWMTPYMIISASLIMALVALPGIKLLMCCLCYLAFVQYLLPAL